MDKLELIVFSGVSGAGKTTSLSALEERGYATIMDLPGELIPGLVALMKEHPKVYGKTAISVPIVAIKEAVEEIRKDEAVSLTSIGLLASREELRKRYRLTRHSHPLEAKGLDLEECLDLDEPVREYIEKDPLAEKFMAMALEVASVSFDSALKEGRNLVVFALGCSGGQHRSVYFASRLAREFKRGRSRSFHREEKRHGHYGS